MANIIAALKQMSVPPTDHAVFQSWLEQEDAITFLRRNTNDDEFVLYANMRNIFIHAVLVPSNSVQPPNVDDLMLWHCDAYSGWGVMTSYSPSPSIEVTSPLHGTGSAAIDQGEQLVFAREFLGRVGDKHYIEIL